MNEDKSKSEIIRALPVVGDRIADRLEGAPTVGVLRLTGVIGQLGPGRRRGLSLSEQAGSIDQAFKLPRLKAVALAINSPGGSVTAGMAIYDTMQFVSCDVATVCLGLAASMGQFLLTAGAAGKRYSLPNARIMMHQPFAGLRGQAADIAIQAEQLAYTKLRMAQLIAEHSGQPLEQIQEDSERDRWFTAEQAKEYGLCDNVILRRGEIV